MLKNRMVDQPYGTYSVYSVLKTGLCVTCPRCGGMGLVTYREGQYRFQCAACGHARAKQLSGYRFRVQNLCQSCGRYYNVPIQDPRRQTFPVLRVPCPYCGFVMPGRVEKTGQVVWYSGAPGLSHRLPKRPPAGKAAGQPRPANSGRHAASLYENGKKSGAAGQAAERAAKKVTEILKEDTQYETRI